MGRLKAILFDLDGVLVDAADWHKEAFNKTLESFGLQPLGDEEHEKTFNGLSTRAKLKILEGEGRLYTIGSWSNTSYDDFYNKKQELTKAIIEERCSPISRVHDAVDFAHYHTGGKIAVVTNCSKETAKLMLERANLTNSFEFMITNEDVDGKIKPHARPYIEAKDKFGLLNTTKKNVLAIDDTDKGIKSALDAGCITWRLRNFEDLSVLNLSNFVRHIDSCGL